MTAKTTKTAKPAKRAPSRPANAGARKSAITTARKQPGSRTPLIIGAVVVVVAIALVAAVARGGNNSSIPDRVPASPAVVAQVTSVSPSVFSTVGVGTATSAPQPISSAPLTTNGKPRILYIGAEYCPFCATERWAMVLALSRFGTFTNLQQTQSSSSDVFPNTHTFSFYGSTYTSKYIVFEPVETETRTGKPLETPTAEQAQLMATWDVAPYTTQPGSIPFMNLGGRYVTTGATYDASVLQGKTAEQIAAALHDPSSPIAKGAVGAANTMTAAICKLTNGQPANVCSDPTIAGIMAKLG